LIQLISDTTSELNQLKNSSSSNQQENEVVGILVKTEVINQIMLSGGISSHEIIDVLTELKIPFAIESDLADEKNEEIYHNYKHFFRRNPDIPDFQVNNLTRNMNIQNDKSYIFKIVILQFN